MSFLTFDRPIGAKADVNELEYITYLHQTGQNVRKDCSIKDADIRNYLMSRYGIKVPIKIVRETILAGLGGSEKEGEVIDLMELASLLLIPVLIKASAVATIRPSADDENPIGQRPIPTPMAASTSPGDNNNSSSSNNRRNEDRKPGGCMGMFSCYQYDDDDDDLAQYGDEVFDTNDGEEFDDEDDDRPSLLPNLYDFLAKIITHDITNDSKPKPLNADLVRDILTAYGESELANDSKLVEEMVQVAMTVPKKRNEQATNDSVEAPVDLSMFNAHTLANGTTYDVLLYDVSNESKMTTLYDDVFPTHVTFRDRASPTAAATSGSNTDAQDMAIKRKFTAPAIDVTAGTFRSKSLMVMLWATAMLIFCVFYIIGLNSLFKGEFCTNPPYKYNTTIESLRSPWASNALPIGCEISSSIGHWLVLFLVVGVMGMLYTGVGSIGNTIDCVVWWHPLVGCVAVLIGTALVWILAPRDNNAVYLTVLTLLAFFLAVIVVYLHVTHALSVLVSEQNLQQNSHIRDWLSESTIQWLQKVLKPRMVLAELMGKKAMANKLNNMAENALRLLIAPSEDSKGNIVDTYCGRALFEYSKKGIRKRESVGGAVWTWRKIYDQTLFDTEGIWFSVRVLSGNIGQFIVCAFMLYAGYHFFYAVDDNYGEKEQFKIFASKVVEKQIAEQRASLTTANVSSYLNEYIYGMQQNGTLNLDCSEFQTPGTDTYSFCKTTQEGVTTCENTTQFSQFESLCAMAYTESGQFDVQQQLELLEQSGFDAEYVQNMTEFAITASIDDTVEYYYPSQKYMVSVPTLIGVVVSFLSAFVLAATYLSGVASTVLQMRCGAIPTLHSPFRDHYRAAADTTALLTGSIFWGCLAGSALTGMIIGSLFFFFMWQATVFWAQRFIALVFGFLSIALLKLLVLQIARSKIYAGFYRINPKFANLLIMALEWANFTLSAGIIIVRMIKLLLVATFSIGRVYQPFLAPGIGKFGPIEADGYPTIHIRELLSHESHRHPYIELMGYIYLMKLKYSDEFGKSAGSCWRLILVHALMPWLRRYRVRARQPGLNPDILNPLIQFKSIRRLERPSETNGRANI